LLKRAAGLGEDIRVRLPERELAGRSTASMTPDACCGAANGIAAVTAGEVFA